MQTDSVREVTSMCKTGCLLGPAVLLAVSTFLLAAEDRPPNVIVILTDDQGTIDANCFGAKDLVTPGIDGLAERRPSSHCL